MFIVPPSIFPKCSPRSGAAAVAGGLAARNRSLVLAAARMLAAAWGTALGCPEAMVGSTCMVGLPALLGAAAAAGPSLRTALAAAPVPAVVAASGGQFDAVAIQVLTRSGATPA
jgi:hypothetical protein